MKNLIFLFLISPVIAGIYSIGHDDPTNEFDAPIPGFIGPDGIGMARLKAFDIDNNPYFQSPRNYVNPIFFAWANEVIDYSPSDEIEPNIYDPDIEFNLPEKALGPVTGDPYDVVSLGDLDSDQLKESEKPGEITLKFAEPIKNLSGADFVVFENAFIMPYIGNFAELAYVEVSVNGIDFYRFPSISKTENAVGPYGSIDPTNIYNLAGKHSNAGGISWGTPFDLSDITEVALSEINYIRIVDIPGSGKFKDSRGEPIYDAWYTWGSGGFDLEAIGSISTLMSFEDWPSLQKLPIDQRGENDDPDNDGIPNLLEYATASIPWEVDYSPAVGHVEIDHSGDEARAVFSFTRDERLTDIHYEVQISTDLDGNSWESIAEAYPGEYFTAVTPHNPDISETSASEIASIGVLRKIAVSLPTDYAPRLFFRLKVTRLP